MVELHTGNYADALTNTEKKVELERLIKAATYASNLGMIVHAGHGLHEGKYFCSCEYCRNIGA